jgi:hypothetical protein
MDIELVPARGSLTLKVKVRWSVYRSAEAKSTLCHEFTRKSRDEEAVVPRIYEGKQKGSHFHGLPFLNRSIHMPLSRKWTKIHPPTNSRHPAAKSRVCSEFLDGDALHELGIRCSLRTSVQLLPLNGHGRANCRRHRRCLCAPGSNPGRRPAGRHEAQKALL